jgi:hypothetical protein
MAATCEALGWTEAEEEWLRQEYPSHGNRELERMKAEDGRPRSARAIALHARKLGITKDRTAGYRKPMPRMFWTPEREAWFRSFVPGHSEGEISAEFERVFGFPLTEGQIGNAKTTFGLRSGTHGGQFRKGQEPPNKGRTWDEQGISPEAQERMRSTQFRKNNLPWNTRPLLDERLVGDTWEIHVGLARTRKANDQWIPRARFNWMAANGRDWPDGHKAIHIDRDPLNDDADNIMPVPDDL